MRLKIKTLKQKTLTVEIEETKTVYELKKELSLNADVGVAPELQQLIYGGYILINNDQLSVYNIDVDKCLVVLILRKPFEEPPSPNVGEEEESIEDIPSDEPEVKCAECLREEYIAMSSDAQGSDIIIYDDIVEAEDVVDDDIEDVIVDDMIEDALFDDDDMVETFTSMGFSENEVRHALQTYSNESSFRVDFFIIDIPHANYDSENQEDTNMAGTEFYRQDGTFNNTRQAVVQDQDLLSVDVQTSADLLDLVDENERAYLAMLLEDINDEADDEAEDEESD